MTTLRLADELEWRVVEEEIVALDVRRGVYFALNRTGALVWKSLAEGTTEDAMVEMLMAEFAVDSATAAGDLAAFLGGLRAHDLLVET